jgi:hypothetical protein
VETNAANAVDIIMQHSSSFTSKVSGKQYNIFCTVNCKSTNILFTFLSVPFVASKNGVEAVSQTGMVCEDTIGSFTFLFFLCTEVICSWR